MPDPIRPAVPAVPMDRSHDLDLSVPRRIHVVGIGGAGMSAVALVLARMGHRVSGSDQYDSPVLERLAAAGIETHASNAAEHVPADADALVPSTAVPDSNVEVVRARALGIPVVHRAGALRAITANRRTAAVAGSHGKTTTSSMLALILRQAGWQPSFLIGGDINEVGTNAGFDEGEWLVVEADESDGTFLELVTEAAIVTNVEPDHLDHHGSFEDLVAAFERFVAGVPGPVALCVDDPVTARLRDVGESACGYGFDAGADYRLHDYEGDRFGCRFRLERPGGADLDVRLTTAGRHNALNAAGAAALAFELGVDEDAVAVALGSFGGVSRRFELRGEVGGVTLVDDYAHLPSEVAAAIAAAREGHWKRVVVVFQPHRFSRISRLWRDFADSFAAADAVVVTDVYAKGEEEIAGVSGRLVVRAVLDRHPSLPLSYLPRHADLLDVPWRLARPGDVVLTLGAGDVTTLPDEWLAREAAR